MLLLILKVCDADIYGPYEQMDQGWEPVSVVVRDDHMHTD